MRSQTQNPNYNSNKANENEEEDSKYINTEFNVLLKQDKNGNWKANLERDTEVKTESADIVETYEDANIYKDLFGTDNTDNAFTANEEVLIEDANTAEAEPSKNISNTTSISSISFSEISIISSQIVPTVSPTENLTLPVAKEKTSWLQNIFSFGSISANAQVAQQYNYSWPWRGGNTWAVGQSWHECESVTKNGGTIYGCALDVQPFKNANGLNVTDNDVLSPITSTVIRACTDTENLQAIYKIGNMSITHIDARTTSNANDGAFVRKGQKLGVVFDPAPFPANTTLTVGSQTFPAFQTNCGTTSGKHLHIKLSPISQVSVNPNTFSGSISIDGQNINGASNYSPLTNPDNSFKPNTPTFTSQNYPNTNTYTGKIKSFTTPNKIFDIYDFNGNNGAAVQLYESGTNNPVNQRWSFDNVNKQIKGMNGRCLTVSSGNNITMQDCTTSLSQKWGFNFGNQIISDANKYCIEAQNGIINGSLLVANLCNSTNNNQKWDFNDIVTLVSAQTKLNVRFNLSGAWNNTTKLMNKDLNTSNKIPLNQPYCTTPWNYCGTENIPDRTKIDQTAVDWVLIEIKNATGTTVQRKAALITSDAYLTDAAGINNPGSFYPIILDNVTTSGSYKIIVRHRNHLAIATNANVTLTPGTTTNTVDLTKNVNVKAANQSSLGSVNGVNVYGMRLGDVNADDYIDATDRVMVANETETFGYNKFDLNLDAIVDATDRNLISLASEALASL